MSSSATREEIKTRFKELVRAYHPDLNGGGSHLRLRRLVVAARQVLDRSSQRVSTYEPGGPRSRGTGDGGDSHETLLYTGRGRIRSSSMWPVYRVTSSKVEVSWPQGPQGRARFGRMSGGQEVLFKDVRNVTQGLLDVSTERCDLVLELAWGSLLRLEELPNDVATQIQGIVEVVREAYLQQRATMRGRCPMPPQAEKRRRRY